MTQTGRCLCGQVRYTLNADKVAAAICHCKHCQRQAGSAFSVIAVASADQLKIHGTLKTYEDTADSGAKLHRQFCPNCGSAMFSILFENPQQIIIKAGTFDDTSWIAPMAHVWCGSAQDWYAFPENVLKFPGNAPVG